MQPIYMIMVFFFLPRQAQWYTSCKKCILWASGIKSMFLNFYYISFQDMQPFFFKFLVSVVNHYHINGLHLFWNSFHAKWFFLSCPRHCDRELVVVIFKFETKKKEHNVIINRVISSHIGSVYIETLYITAEQSLYNVVVYFLKFICKWIT